MEKVICNEHGSVCMLKTGVKEGPRKGKSFYVCVDKQGCDFSQFTSIPPSHCLHHEDSMVELQALTYSPQQECYRLFYRCIVGKKAGQRWCGNVPWTGLDKKIKTPADTHVQPSSLSPVRNPFKAPEKLEKDLKWKLKQSSDGEGNEVNQKSHKNEARKCDLKEESTEGQVEEDKENGAKPNLADTYRGKPLPAGMKLKKRLSDEERITSKGNSVNKTADEVKSKLEEKHLNCDKTKRAVSTSNVDETEPNKENKTSPVTYKDLNQQPAPTEGCVMDQKQPVEKEVSSKDAGGSSRGTESKCGSAKPTSDQQGHSDDKNADDDHDDDDVVLVSVKPAAQKTPPASAVQKSITTFPGFQPASKVKGQQPDPKGLRSLLTAQLEQKKATLSVVNTDALPDKGQRLRTQVRELEEALESLSLTAASQTGSQDEADSSAPRPASSHMINPFSRQGGTILLPAPPAAGPSHNQPSSSSMGLHLSQGLTQTYGANPQVQVFYGGRMTDDRLLAVKNATSEAIDHLHKSLESCPDAEAETPDPRGIKVTLLAHQRRALAWLLWREAQKPCGGILADDMGLGKTLTMIALILDQKTKAKEEEVKKEEKKLEKWLSKTDPSVVASKGTLIICPASLVHHWKKEIERHVKTGRLTVCLYHGQNRERSARVLSDYDVVVTTYGLVSKEIPVQKEETEKPSDGSDEAAKSPSTSPLMRVAWARVILDEAHNIKNPKVQTSQAVCQLRACARWAVTGTPIQNNLLDMYSLLKFLRCSPFDEYKLWKAQVDNGSKRGRERLNILTRTLLLRRTKDQLDSTGKPLVSLPDRTCEVHRLKLSKDEKAVYDVVFAQSKSTLQNYLKRHEGNDVSKGNKSSSNPFDKVAQEFGFPQPQSAVSSSQQASSTVHILSLLLRLRQCCCHLSLLRKTLDSSELQADGVVLSLEEQLNALSLSSGSSPSDPDPKDSVALNGTRFSAELFAEGRESTKISSIVSELKAIRQKSDVQKSVIVSQWTSMLQIVALHLQQMGLRYGVIDGSVNPKRRMDLVEEFNTNPKGPEVMLVSLCAGGVGLNLIGGNHLFLIDMHWNPALEDQACDRIYRVGQRKDVTIHRFVCEDTVEEKISTLQEKKKELAQNVLSGTGSTFTKLSLADLRIIFGV